MSIEDKIDRIDIEILLMKININSYYGQYKDGDINILNIYQRRVELEKEKSILIKNLERKNKLDKIGKISC